ncbi:MAG: GNAT family N-acetyltransferase [Armatimonadota bacterium]
MDCEKELRDVVSIRRIAQSEIDESARVIRESFATVALEFGITEENCPTHPAFITRISLDEMLRSGIELHGLFIYGCQVGAVTIENVGENAYYLGKLAILPDFRRRGLGDILVGFAIDNVKARGATLLKLATVDKATRLKNWYKGFGFVETGTKKFDHMPFTVCFMQKRLTEE